MMSRYDWASFPKEVCFAATDSNGNVFGYDIAPKYFEFGKWMPENEFLIFLYRTEPSQHCDQSLEVRPVELSQ